MFFSEISHSSTVKKSPETKSRVDMSFKFSYVATIHSTPRSIAMYSFVNPFPSITIIHSFSNPIAINIYRNPKPFIRSLNCFALNARQYSTQTVFPKRNNLKRVSKKTTKMKGYSTLQMQTERTEQNHTTRTTSLQ